MNYSFQSPLCRGKKARHRKIGGTGALNVPRQPMISGVLPTNLRALEVSGRGPERQERRRAFLLCCQFDGKFAEWSGPGLPPGPRPAEPCGPEIVIRGVSTV